MKSKASIAILLEMLERELHTESASNKSRTADLLAEDIIEFGRSGQNYSKVEILASLDSAPADSIASYEYKLNLLRPTVALLTYKSKRNSIPKNCTLRSSINCWCCLRCRICGGCASGFCRLLWDECARNPGKGRKTGPFGPERCEISSISHLDSVIWNAMRQRAL